MSELPDEVQEEIVACRNNLSFFIEKAFKIVDPSTPYMHNWHIDAIAEALQCCYRGEIKRLLITIPPRYCKSISVNVAYPAWLLGKNPAATIISASYSLDLSLRHSVACRTVVQDDWYKLCFPNTVLASDQNEKSQFMTTKRGYRFATSVGASVTGAGGNLLILDDIHSAMQAQSATIRESQIEWIDQSFLTRLNDKKNGVIIGIAQRLHLADAMNHLMKQGGYTCLDLPAIFDKQKTISIGMFHKKIEKGEVLHPEREDRKMLDKLKKQMGTANFSAQYLQKPVPDGGGIIKYEWINLWPADIPLPKFTYIIQSWDTAFTEKTSGDPSGCATFGVFFPKDADADVVMRTGAGYCVMLIDWFSEHLAFPDLRAKILEMRKYQYGEQEKMVDMVLVEKKASGQCYDDNTEILTRHGWKFFKDINIKNDEFATRNIKTKQFEWQKAIAEFHENYEGDMYHFKGKTQDLLVTPNHRMLVNSIPRILGGYPSNRKKYQEDFITAEDLVKFGGDKTFTPLISKWKGKKIKRKSLEPETFIAGKAEKICSAIKLSGDDYIKFMAMYLAEGWTQFNKKRTYSIHIGQVRHSKYYEEFKEVLKRMGKIQERRGEQIYLTNRKLYEFVRQFGLKCDNKYIPDDIMNADSKQLALFWKWYVKGDGHITDKGHVSITTTSKKMSDQLQEIAQKMGYSVSIRVGKKYEGFIKIGKSKVFSNKATLKTHYIVRLRTSKMQKLRGSKIIYKGNIHCISVPNQTLYVRRNGYPSWCGNSIIQELRNANLPVKDFNPGRQDKTQRLHSISHLIENGLLYVPESPHRRGEPMSWAEEFINQLCQFPAAEHDEAVDCCVQTCRTLSDMNFLRADDIADDIDEDDSGDPWAFNQVNPYSA